MKSYVIKDADDYDLVVGYLLYYEKVKQFYVELIEGLDYFDVPPILNSVIKKGNYSVDSTLSKYWVKQRIVPEDRQNIHHILKNHNLKEYDEYKLLLLGHGRCAQDECYIERVDNSVVEELFHERFQTKVENAITLDNHCILVAFRNGKVKKCHLPSMNINKRQFKPILERADYFKNMILQVDGYGIQWGTTLFLSNQELYQQGIDIPLSKEDLQNIAKNQVVDTLEAADMLGCSRQYINELVRKGQIIPIKSSSKSTLFYKNDIEKIKWK